MMRRSLVFLFVALLGMVGSHRAQLGTDECRWMEAEGHRQIFVPSPKATKVASLGFDLIVADLLWTRAVLLFVDFLDSESEHGAPDRDRARSAMANPILLRRQHAEAAR